MKCKHTTKQTHYSDTDTYIAVQGHSTGTMGPADMHSSCVGLDTEVTPVQTSQDIAHRLSTSAQTICAAIFND